MEAQLYFSERQRPQQFWVWLPVGLIDALLTYGSIVQLVFGRPFGSHPASNAGLIIIACLVILLNAGLFSILLEAGIGADGITVRFPPIIWRQKLYPWDTISEAYIREYRPIRDFGGWGIRWGSDGKAYTVGGKVGIQLVFKDGSRLLIGTAKAQEAEAALRRLGRLQQLPRGA